MQKLMPACPRCKSADVKLVAYRGQQMRVCNVCGFDETTEFESEAGEKTSQKAKGSYSPYKTGGPSRTRR
ncbi:hypothetical protein HY493_05225 [Candidatus Woesearchaeota archaeon]|nr:hypothetical protein [Candidatus Woesearchaeota archaeon]